MIVKTAFNGHLPLNKDCFSRKFEQLETQKPFLYTLNAYRWINIRLRLQSAIYPSDYFVLMLRYCANLKAIKYESASVNRIVADKSHRVIVALNDYLQSVSWILAERCYNRSPQGSYTGTCTILQETINGFLCPLIVFRKM